VDDDLGDNSVAGDRFEDDVYDLAALPATIRDFVAAAANLPAEMGNTIRNPASGC
jgi:hypothetical protein